ncbi:MKRN2 opposite strand, tandem duplicate 1 [Gadus morhua]|uniref:MKRN2 opposite strand, tandem duplicate 1 n=1 Tax=Gadus morhua TaxID=8049 RepID=A0A8C5C281_GADMO|nr:MKRN2 opposite strand protein-like [Gadus morhua]
MENIVRFEHCGELIYTFTHREDTRSSAEEPGGTGSGPAGVPSGRCPLCGDRLSFRLLDAPVAVPCPFSNGHETPCAFLLSSRSGPTSISEQNDSELHVGISNSEGVVFSYTESGVQRQQQSWEKSLTIPLITPSNHPSVPLITPSNHPSPVVVTPSNHPSPPLLPGSVVRSWDRRLETFSSQDRWTTDRFSEEGEFGSCCYGFALSFINEVRRSEVMEVISQNTFTLGCVLPTIQRSSKYLSLYDHIRHHGYYLSTTA